MAWLHVVARHSDAFQWLLHGSQPADSKIVDLIVFFKEFWVTAADQRLEQLYRELTNQSS